MEQSEAQWLFVPMEEEHGRLICSWRYPEPYAVFNWSPWDELQERSEEFGDPSIRKEQFEGVLDRDGQLCGFAQFFPLVGWTRLGLGLRPDLCGQGLGPSFTSAIVGRAMQRRPEDGIDLEVLTSNSRAQRAYLKAGFAIRDTYVRNTPTGPDEFHCMVYEGGTSPTVV
ncbi:GNAT family N-acetyltransferase [Paenibacillus hemerocallicola]|uniref:GNAT family N-acetyltransferase n=1 Tax=Paenibacillus hemerocallicola TaxID=1172614 RepID=A0A5C4T189_9BACL|nr:GNAT family N-acetyltransferase [Paenibacillus hemerocallicola]TNJ62862.1 GNAT family N-acetyltransferase [Paenibacillus hemerocallicola]